MGVFNQMAFEGAVRFCYRQIQPRVMRSFRDVCWWAGLVLGLWPRNIAGQSYGWMIVIALVSKFPVELPRRRY